MVLKLAQKQKRGMGLNILLSKSRQNVLLEVNFSKFHKLILFETGKGYFRAKNRVGKGNGLFYQFFIKNGKKG